MSSTVTTMRSTRPAKRVKDYEHRNEREQRRKVGVPRRDKGEDRRRGEQDDYDYEPELILHLAVPPIWSKSASSSGERRAFSSSSSIRRW